ncbi:MAG: DNA gyrase inhibitor YacG [Hyphomicrobiaceae bacterium]
MTAESRRPKLRCPICRNPAAEAFRPFCSKRCADVDLARWLGGSYAIPGHQDTEEDGDAQPAATGPGRRAAEAPEDEEPGIAAPARRRSTH